MLIYRAFRGRNWEWSKKEVIVIFLILSISHCHRERTVRDWIGEERRRRFVVGHHCRRPDEVAPMQYAGVFIRAAGQPWYRCRVSILFIAGMTVVGKWKRRQRHNFGMTDVMSRGLSCGRAGW